MTMGRLAEVSHLEVYSGAEGSLGITDDSCDSSHLGTT